MTITPALLRLVRMLVMALLWSASLSPAVVFSAADQPLQVFILAGQSNMQGHAHVRTFPHIGMDPATAPLLAEMQNADGTPKVCDRVWISSLGSADREQFGRLTTGYGAAAGGPKIGPEFTFGIRMKQHVQGPILIIKTAWGGKSLNTDFRSPSAGPYVFDEKQRQQFQKQGKDIPAIQAEKDQATGQSYRLMIEHVKSVLADIKRVYPDYDPAQGYELAGFVWFQGWNDMVDSGTYPNRDQPGGYDAYTDAMVHFIRDVRKDLQAPKLPFVIGVLGVGGPVEEYGPDQQRYEATHRNFRLAMAAPAQLPEFQGNVAAVLTEKCWDQELTKLRAQENVIRQQVKKLVSDGKIESAEERATFEKLRTEQLSDRDRQILDTGISNAEFHYLGSAKILGRIGIEFAEAIAALRKQ